MIIHYDLTSQGFLLDVYLLTLTLIVPLINEMFHPDVPLDRNTFIQHLSNDFISPDGKSEKFTDSQIQAGSEYYHIECDCYEKEKIIFKMVEYDLYAELNNVKINIRNSVIQKPFTVPVPVSGVLFLRRPSDADLPIRFIRQKIQMQYHFDTIVLADYTIEDLTDKDLYILVPFYLFNHEKDIAKYNTDAACRRRVLEAMRKMVQAINKGLREDKFLIFDYGILTAMMKTVTEGLTKQNKEIEKELDEIMSEGVLKIPGKEYCLRVKDQYISEGINETKRNNALTMIADGKLSIDDISRYSGLSKEEVKSLNC